MLLIRDSMPVLEKVDAMGMGWVYIIGGIHLIK